MLKRVFALACALTVGSAMFVGMVGCDDKKPDPAPAPQTDPAAPVDPAAPPTDPAAPASN